MALSPVFAIFIECNDAVELQREQVHAAVKTHAKEWWHGLDDLWFVAGRSAEEWRNLVGPIFPTTGAGKVFVIRVSEPFHWAYRAKFPETSSKWLKENLTSD
jgi:hypothetical protein